MHLIRKSNTGLGMIILIGLALVESAYNVIFHPVMTYQLVVNKRGWRY